MGDQITPTPRLHNHYRVTIIGLVDAAVGHPWCVNNSIGYRNTRHSASVCDDVPILSIKPNKTKPKVPISDNLSLRKCWQTHLDKASHWPVVTGRHNVPSPLIHRQNAALSNNRFWFMDSVNDHSDWANCGVIKIRTNGSIIWFGGWLDGWLVGWPVCTDVH